MGATSREQADVADSTPSAPRAAAGRKQVRLTVAELKSHTDRSETANEYSQGMTTPSAFLCNHLPLIG